MRRIIGATLLVAIFALLPRSLQAAPLASPKGTPILEIAGSIAVKNRGDKAVFDREMLENVGLQTIVTTTPWDKGEVRYEGVPLAKLMDVVQAKGATARVRALNDYVTLIPMEDFTEHNVILALRRNGKYMPIRDKGPLFVVYPYDSDPALQSQIYYARSAWQVKSIEVEP
jgi:hypothetical protein